MIILQLLVYLLVASYYFPQVSGPIPPYPTLTLPCGSTAAYIGDSFRALLELSPFPYYPPVLPLPISTTHDRPLNWTISEYNPLGICHPTLPEPEAPVANGTVAARLSLYALFFWGAISALFCFSWLRYLSRSQRTPIVVYLAEAPRPQFAEALDFGAEAEYVLRPAKPENQGEDLELALQKVTSPPTVVAGPQKSTSVSSSTHGKATLSQRSQSSRDRSTPRPIRPLPAILAPRSSPPSSSKAHYIAAELDILYGPELTFEEPDMTSPPASSSLVDLNADVTYGIEHAFEHPGLISVQVGIDKTSDGEMDKVVEGRGKHTSVSIAVPILPPPPPPSSTAILPPSPPSSTAILPPSPPSSPSSTIALAASSSVFSLSQLASPKPQCALHEKGKARAEDPDMRSVSWQEAIPLPVQPAAVGDESRKYLVHASSSSVATEPFPPQQLQLSGDRRAPRPIHPSPAILAPSSPAPSSSSELDVAKNFEAELDLSHGPELAFEEPNMTSPPASSSLGVLHFNADVTYGIEHAFEDPELSISPSQPLATVKEAMADTQEPHLSVMALELSEGEFLEGISTLPPYSPSSSSSPMGPIVAVAASPSVLSLSELASPKPRRALREKSKARAEDPDMRRHVVPTVVGLDSHAWDRVFAGFRPEKAYSSLVPPPPSPTFAATTPPLSISELVSPKPYCSLEDKAKGKGKAEYPAAHSFALREEQAAAVEAKDKSALGLFASLRPGEVPLEEQVAAELERFAGQALSNAEMRAIKRHAFHRIPLGRSILNVPGAMGVTAIGRDVDSGDKGEGSSRKMRGRENLPILFLP
ncbi:hypothetical protein MVEN_01796300 [Mycena venus]|uniref:Proteophosphoglycan ppg4 n=1 Tax=Mycena venus TaxID=2733690 RepID=A0A8H6XID9_9AGAR|nr:hypothetical protein MVEN_01796300 [Mycena venus]